MSAPLIVRLPVMVMLPVKSVLPNTDRGLAEALLLRSPNLSRLVSRFQNWFNAEGEISDHASDELRSARKIYSSNKRKIKKSLESFVQKYSQSLSGQYFTDYEGRQVLPMRADTQQRISGQIVGSSNSGGTLYVEPAEVGELSSELKRAEAAIHREEVRLLAEFAKVMRDNYIDYAATTDHLIEADHLSSVQAFASEYHATLIEPNSEEREIFLDECRHPLLLLQGAVIPNRFQMTRGSALVISGPNAGGKTVGLTAIALCVIMAQCSLPLPVASGSTLPIFEDVWTEIGDQQSLSMSLSTFSAHILHLASMLELSNEHSLILIDEIAGGTDPDEAQVLAQAILESYLDRGATVIATTHYERLKRLALDQAERFSNCAVGFDFDRLRPTFRLHAGIAGASSALHVASRFGIHSSLIERSKELLPAQLVRQQELLEQLEAQREAIERERQTLKETLRKQQSRLREIETEKNRARDEERKRLEKQTQEVTQEVSAARFELRRLRKEHQNNPDLLKQAERTVNTLASTVSIGGKLRTLSAQDTAALAKVKTPEFQESELKVGLNLYVLSLGSMAILDSLPNKGKVTVRFGAMRMQVSTSDLRRSAASASSAAKETSRSTLRNPKKSKYAASPQSENEPGEQDRRTTDNSLDLRGERVEDAIDKVERFIDELNLNNESHGFILHGHGTGALKQALRRHLQLSTRIARFEAADSENGGDAWTVIIPR